ncbi:MAG: hypothetical protein LCH84_17755 [Gemmatimonadetes bacterium]|nr:hypothetical protein [Gemmatimonadota bacterium]
MTMRTFSAGALLLTSGSALLASTLVAQNAPPKSPTANVPLREVTEVIARTERGLGNVNTVRALSDGGVLVNDGMRRQLLRFDASLKNVVAVADTAPGALMPYGQRQLGLIPYQGDSSLVVDPATMSLVLIDGKGKTSRVMSSPRPNDINMLAGMNLGTNAFDAQGRMYYRQGNVGGGPGGGGVGMMFGSGNDRGGGRGGNQQGGNQQGGNQQNRNAQQGRGGGGDFGGGFGGGGFGGGGQGGPGGPGGFGGPGGRGFNPQNQPDSVPIVRVNFDTRKADTVTFVKVPKNETQMTRGEDGQTRITVKINPLPQADDWSLLSDGTVAVIRVLDYHVDYYTPDGKHIAGERLPYDWKQIPDDDKQKFVDSLKALAKVANDRASNGAGGGMRMMFEPIAFERFPDYFPPVRQGASIADRDGNLWVIPSTSTLASQLAQQMQQGMGGGRGGMGGMGGMGGAPGGPPGGAPPGAAGAAAGQGGRGERGGRGGAGSDSTRAGGLPPAAIGLLAAAANQPPIVYDVIGRDGKLRERVKLPAGRQIAGFGPNGLIYLQAREGREVHLEVVKLK